jgi:hydrogenase maturation protease
LKIIIGYGNTLRGEDGFGVEVIEKLRTFSHLKAKLISVHSLTPELVLELLDAEEIIFVDACYDPHLSHVFACSLLQESSKLSHHIQPQFLILILKELYNQEVNFSIYSMLTNSFDFIDDKFAYHNCIEQLVEFLKLAL